MRRLLVVSLGILGLVLAGCTGGAAGSPSDDIGDIVVIGHSPGNGDELDTEDSIDGFNALNNPTLLRRGSVAITFSNTQSFSAAGITKIVINGTNSSEKIILDPASVSIRGIRADIARPARNTAT